MKSLLAAVQCGLEGALVSNSSILLDILATLQNKVTVSDTLLWCGHEQQAPQPQRQVAPPVRCSR